MNFLALVQDLARQSGTLAGGVNIASVTNVSGRADKLVNWIASAWEDIQNERKWNWLKGEFETSLIPGTARYTGASFNLADFGDWCEETRWYQPLTLYDVARGRADESELGMIDYSVWRVQYDRRLHDATRPNSWCISPANELCIGPTPDAAYVLRGEYWKRPQPLAANTDTPAMPARYHKAIVYRAMMLMAGGDESIVTLNLAEKEFNSIFSDMCNDRSCLPHVSVRAAGPLA